MGESKRPDTEQNVRALKVDVPAELRLQLKREAVELDIPVRQYVQEILENRLPSEVMKSVAERAQRENMTYREFMLRLLQRAGIIT
ncbi:hypothetical protein [Polyangium aurulentum]|uniref:hypothetical protein n=1 Tax=Polyangium aurulentum TaxID=2567896 RepID=UPI0010AE54CC|nr:hypothetical protein [Polyangium aurulentum]UQA58581.1 hypothetical protein E8A73_046325 [Polyangium aurulentum]